MTKSLITGIGGFVASHLAEYLLEKGEEVIGTFRWTEDLSRIKHIQEKINLIPVDLLDFSAVLRCIGKYRPQYIYHLAAQSYVTDSFTNPLITIETNTMGTVKLLEAIRKVKSDLVGLYDPMVHICSSSEVYGLVSKDLVPIKEDCRFNPSNPYAVGKVGADMAGLMYWTNFKIRTIRTRMFTHTGYRRSMLSCECAFARQIARIEKGLQEPVLYHGNLNSVRTWADVRDAVRAYWIMMRKCRPGQAYNIGGNQTKTVGEMLNYMISLSPMKDKIKLKLDPKLLRPYDVTLQIPNCSKFIKETDWKPIYTFEQTIQEVLNWWRQNI